MVLKCISLICYLITSYHYKLIDVREANKNLEYTSQISNVVTIAKPYVSTDKLDEQELNTLVIGLFGNT